MPNISAFLQHFGENLQHMEISLDLRPAHNPQLFHRIVLQIWVLWIQRCFTGLETNPSYSRGELADRSSVNDWQQNKEGRKLKPTRREAMHTLLRVCAYTVWVCVCVGFSNFLNYAHTVFIFCTHTHTVAHTQAYCSSSSDSLSEIPTIYFSALLHRLTLCYGFLGGYHDHIISAMGKLEKHLSLSDKASLWVINITFWAPWM